MFLSIVIILAAVVTVVPDLVLLITSYSFATVTEGKELVYHRLDLLPTDNTCMHLKQLATLG